MSMVATPKQNGKAPWTVDNPPTSVRRFVRWYVEDREVGAPITAYADRPGVSVGSVQAWARDPRVIDLLDRALRASNSGPQKIQAVLEMLYLRATVQEDVKAAQLYLQAVDRLQPKSRIDVVHHDARGLTDEDLRQELHRAVALLDGQRNPTRRIGTGQSPALGIELPILDAEVLDDGE